MLIQYKVYATKGNFIDIYFQMHLNYLYDKFDIFHLYRTNLVYGLICSLFYSGYGAYRFHMRDLFHTE